MAAVAGDEGIDAGFDRAGKDQVVGGVACQSLGAGCRGWCDLDRQIEKELLDLAPAPRLKFQLARKDALQLRRVDQCLGVFGADREGLDPLAAIALQAGEALELGDAARAQSARLVSVLTDGVERWRAEGAMGDVLGAAAS